MIAGLVMTVVFQLAHVVSGPEFVAEYDHKIAKSWHMHQMSTTSNFATKNRFVAYLLGGLNFQIEHHLFPQICHVHYPEISKIIKETAEKYNVPYHHHNGFWQAVYSHYSLLRSLGNTP
jgi:linoleoyl-CoA desaturase